MFDYKYLIQLTLMYIIQYKMAFSALVYSEKINRLYNVGKWKDEGDNVKVIT